ncbi:MAG: SPOR domain-containing protein [Candidatus Omnitrophota bacterium]|nr:SPOR domain-containing protein [Candidatus Omnitrophota bacterium]
MKKLGAAALLLLCLTASAGAEELSSLQASFLRGDYSGVVREIRSMEAQGRDLNDGALYLWGVSALQLDHLEEGRLVLERLMARYPQSPWRVQAQQVLRQGTFYYCVQVGSFSSERNAERLSSEMKRRGYASEVSEGVLGGKTFYRVRIGRFASRPEAEVELKKLKQEGFPGRIFP